MKQDGPPRWWPFRQVATNRTLRPALPEPVAGPTSQPGGGFPDAQPHPSPSSPCSLLYRISLAPEQNYAAMPKNKTASVKIPAVVAAVVRRVNTRLSRMEDLLLEMRAEQDVKLKKIEKLQQQVEELMATQQPKRLWR